MQKIKKYKNIFLVNADPIKNAGNIKEYFIDNSLNFAAFHFFPGYSNKKPYFELYFEGKLQSKKVFKFYRGNNFFIKIIINHLAFYYVAFFIVKKESIFITNAPLFLVGNSILVLFKSFKPVVWFGDYYEINKFPMNLYNIIVDHYNKSLKNVIYLTPRLKEAYKSKKNRKIIGLGIKNNLRKNKYKFGNKIKVGFIGVIRKQQGLDLFFNYLKENNDCVLEVVGEGYHLEEYKKLAKKMNIHNKVKFLGVVEDLSNVFPRWDVGIALYENTPNNLSKYCEPTKIKDYLSYGLPVITTKTTYFHEEIKKYNAGVVVDENVSSIKVALNKIKINYPKYLKGVEKIVDYYSYEEWYDQNFKFLTKL